MLKYETLIKDEEISMDELPAEVIRQIKVIKKLQESTAELTDDDPKKIAVNEKDDKICAMINKWLDDVVEEDDGEETPAEEKSSEKNSKTDENNNPDEKNQKPPVKKEENKIPDDKKPPVNSGDDDSVLIEKIKSKLKGIRIHEKDLTEILGKKPSSEVKLNGMKLKRVFLGDGWYQVSK